MVARQGHLAHLATYREFCHAGPISFTKDNAPTLIPGEIAVKCLRGNDLPVSSVEGETVTEGSTIYTGVAEFSPYQG